MTINYAKALPRDTGNAPMTGLVPPYTALKTYSSENATASSVITVTDNTTAIELGTQGGPAVMKWIASTDTTASVISAAGTANFDHYIPSGSFRRFVIPIEKNPAGSVVGANIANGLYNRFAYKSIGAASVLATEY